MTMKWSQAIPMDLVWVDSDSAPNQRKTKRTSRIYSVVPHSEANRKRRSRHLAILRISSRHRHSCTRAQQRRLRHSRRLFSAVKARSEPRQAIRARRVTCLILSRHHRKQDLVSRPLVPSPYLAVVRLLVAVPRHQHRFSAPQQALLALSEPHRLISPCLELLLIIAEVEICLVCLHSSRVSHSLSSSNRFLETFHRIHRIRLLEASLETHHRLLRLTENK